MPESREFDGWIEALDRSWSLPDGTLYRLRDGHVEIDRLDELIRRLRSIEVPDEVMIPKRLASLLWMMPTFMEWQIERVIERGGNAGDLRSRTQLVYNEVERILGIP